MSDFEMPYFVDGGGNRGYFKDQTARQSIAEIVKDSTNYCEIGNTLIQWGQINIATTAGSTSTKSVSFPKSYANPNYLAVSINPMTGDDVRARASSYTTTGFTACVTDNSSTTRYLAWIAVGKKA